MCRSVGRGGDSHYRRGPSGSGFEDGDAGTPDCQSGEHYHPHPKAGREAMVEAGPGPLGLCLVRGVTKVVRESKIWVANVGSHPVEIEENQVVAMG